MTCYASSYTGLPKANSEIEEIIWLSYSDKDKISEVDKLIFDFFKRLKYVRINNTVCLISKTKYPLINNRIYILKALFYWHINGS
jgi:hypothetical protein